MKNRYSAALMGCNRFFKAIGRCAGSRFTGIRAFVLVPDAQEKLELKIEYCAPEGLDHVTLTSRNWCTGQERTLYRGPLTNGQHRTPPRQRE